MFRRRGKGPVGHVEGVSACSRIVKGGSSRPGRRAGTAAAPAPWRRGVGGACRRAGVTGPAWVVGSGGGNRTGVIGNGVASARWPRRQLTRGRRARVSAQPPAARIMASRCARGRVATWRLSCSTQRRAGVFAAWPAAWRYGGCWTAKRVTGPGVGAGVVNGW